MQVAETLIPKDRSFYVSRCAYCGFEVRTNKISGSSVPITKTGSYQSATTPTPIEFIDEMYEAATISFVVESGSTSAYLSDSAKLFSDKQFTHGMTLRVETTSTTNDGDYTISTVTAGEISLTSDLAITESSSTAGTVTLSRVLYKPNITSGCALCGSLNYKGE
jgi:hypothetical protein